jgi:hypothetical protein
MISARIRLKRKRRERDTRRKRKSQKKFLWTLLFKISLKERWKKVTRLLGAPHRKNCN